MLRRKALVGALLAGVLVLASSAAGALMAPPDDGGGGGGGGDAGGGGGGGEVDFNWQPDAMSAATTTSGYWFEQYLLPARTGVLPEYRPFGKYGKFTPSCANDFCAPDIPLESNFCMDPVNLPGDNMIGLGIHLANIGRSCYNLLLAMAFGTADGVDPNPIEFTLQQFQRDIQQQCNEQASGAVKYLCYYGSGVAMNKARPLVELAYGRLPVFGFNYPLPAGVTEIPQYPHPAAIPVWWSSSRQNSHAFVATCGWGGSGPCYWPQRTRAPAPGST